MAEHLHELVDAKLEAKEAEVGETDWAIVERLVLLRTIDSLWVEHLTELDDMRRGIGLRGYAQQDPLNEFRREAFAPLRGAARLHPPPGGEHDLPRDGHSRGDPTAGDADADARCRDVGRPSAMAAGGNGDGPARRRSGRSRRGGRRPGRQRGGRPRAAIGSRGPRGPRVARRRGRSAAGGRGPARAARCARATPRSGDRIGRNDACWCGSGLKYKSATAK